MLLVVAKKPAVFIEPVLEMSTPFGLTKNTCPFAFSIPSIADWELPSTLLSVTLDTLGWLKLTTSFLATPKLFQFITALLLA